ncbi:hypothetical protein EDB89DRAFT_1902946 [Lactarius sanguifluus]|nr:hypothetical protein EDB89DRAFT_1902946 [Lactarius sanguifluus]
MSIEPLSALRSLINIIITFVFMAQPQQPNFHDVGNHLMGLAGQVNEHLTTVATQVHLMPNMLVVQQGGQILEILQRLDAMQEAITNLQATVTTVNTWCMLTLANATASMTAPILYPPNGPLPNGFLITKLTLVTINDDDVQVTVQYLGLPPLQPGAALVDHHQQLINYLRFLYLLLEPPIKAPTI